MLRSTITLPTVMVGNKSAFCCCLVFFLSSHVRVGDDDDDVDDDDDGEDDDDDADESWMRLMVVPKECACNMSNNLVRAMSFGCCRLELLSSYIVAAQ